MTVQRDFGYVTRGRNRNAYVSMQGCVVKRTERLFCFQPLHLPQWEYWIAFSVCEQGDEITVHENITTIKVREWYVTRKMAVTKQKRGSYANSQSGEKKEWVTLHGDIAAVREKAILFMPKSDPESEAWIPRSQIENEAELGEEDDVDINVAKWFCDKEELS